MSVVPAAEVAELLAQIERGATVWMFPHGRCPEFANGSDAALLTKTVRALAGEVAQRRGAEGAA